ncbi:MAG: hypothetical protein DIZ80_13380 [endosymbiont of Galathealinum brachiosum]|uniref:HD-GYP domain-containing protein n=1 Tax=endosymbiont of Galathealinum brachiosum TaxID=2200906 RepID=A0A370D853_9GAMM|nr:MAG: hypothetical protein DIZ80_13380 [endosymbiont of Galathealinum brachiosum]
MTKSKKYSLRFILTSLFTILMLCVGGVIASLNYTQITKLLLSAADNIYDRVATEFVLNFQNTYSPVRNSIKLLSHSDISNSTTFKQRLGYIGLITEAMDTEDTITAMQFGYENGDYFIVRKINTENLKKKFSAPEDAEFVVDNTNEDDAGSILLSRVFLNKNLHVIKRVEDTMTTYDPRTRPWFKQASQEPHAIAPYYFFFMHQVGTTVTMKMYQSNTVIATDLTLENMSNHLIESKMTPASEMYLVTEKGLMIASTNTNDKLIKTIKDNVILKNVSESSNELLSYLVANNKYEEKKISFKYQGKYWQGVIKRVGALGGDDLYLLSMTPVRELLKDAVEIGLMSIYLLFVIILFALPVVWYISKRMSISMHQLGVDAKQIMNFDFSDSNSPKSKIEEVDDLAKAQGLMKSSLGQFMSLINSLVIEKDFESLLDKITVETLYASKAMAVATYLIDEEEITLRVDSLKTGMGVNLDSKKLPVFSLESNEKISDLFISQECKYFQQNSNDDQCWVEFASQLNEPVINVILLPLRNRQAEFMGMIALIYPHSDEAAETNQQSLSFIQAFSGFAAVSLESKQLLKMQEELLDAFIKLIAGAIDAKSPYTGGHCQRVPEIAKMLAQAACDSSEPFFIDYSLDDEQWQELHIASWLHDCGKVTTPEYVVDKSTKLETIYDRIHEIRTRFEVLKRDAEIEYWKAVSKGGDIDKLKISLQQTINELDDDFEFVATCNQGGEFMEDEKLARLSEISDKRWVRTLNDRLGVSWEEAKRMESTPEQKLPVEEYLLADKAEHIIERPDSEKIADDNPWGFNLDIPEYKFNRGELYNMSVKAGTLTNEERYIINEHMVQTIKMLDQLPFPSHLKQVPAIAGGHHESMDGTGYPKRLTKDDMSLTARMMAIADIFEALTASDRPYKKAKSLTVSLKIMSGMRDRKHIDTDLFDLFLRSGVYLEYAEKFLSQDQIDAVDITQYLSSP